jgi:hypothetical protein
MAAPKDAPEEAFRLRKFQGTNTEIDSTFLGGSLVSLSENWIPTQSYRLGKRPGTTLMQQVGYNVANISDLLLARSASASYLYAYCQRDDPDIDFIAVSVNEQAFATDPPGVNFSTFGAIGRMVAFRDRIYCGNGVDPIKSWKLGAPSAETLTFGALATLDASSGPVVAVDNPANHAGESMKSGGYQYCWAVFDNLTGLYVSRSAAQSIAIGAGANNTGQTLSVTTPTTALGPNQVYRFFIAYRGFPIEYATAQGATAPAGTHTFITIEVTEMRCPTYGIARTGNMFVVWRNRVVFSGMASDPTSVFATDTILPGLEQQIFNQGTIFPVNAKVPLPADCTGVGIAGVTTNMDASSPLLFFTLSRTFICQGDPFSTVEEATLVEVSSRVGCIGHDSIVNTPVGTLFVGLDSVYLIPPGGGYPQDVGWPISDQIRQIPPGLRSRIVATFHKQFYKLAIPQSGSATNSAQWWLDLRQGVGDTPSWWGPHNGAVSAFATDPSNPIEIDRGYAAIATTAIVIRTHQVGNYSDYVPGSATAAPIISRLRSGRFDADQPFIVKVFTRIRLIAQTMARSAIMVTMQTDGGVSWQIPDILLGEDMDDPGQFVHLIPTDPPPPPPNQSFNTARFGTVSPAEVQTIVPYTRPRGLSAVVMLTHAPRPEDANPLGLVPNVELRDFELLYMLSERKVRYVGFTVGGRAQRPERISK